MRNLCSARSVPPVFKLVNLRYSYLITKEGGKVDNTRDFGVPIEGISDIGLGADEKGHAGTVSSDIPTEINAVRCCPR